MALWLRFSQCIAGGVVGLFTHDSLVIHLGTQYLRAYVLDCMAAGVHFCFSGFFAATGYSMVSFIHNITSIIVARIPGAYFACKLFPDTLFPMGLAAPIGGLVSIVDLCDCLSHACPKLLEQTKRENCQWLLSVKWFIFYPKRKMCMKIGLVCEGGGMKCAYGAGVLDKFYDDHISFDYCVGVSAGSANLASYLAGQRGRNYRFYTKWLKDPEFYGKKAFLHSGDLFGLEYIYGTLTNSDGKDPIDYSAIQKNPAQFELVATKAVSGQPVYLDKSIMKQDDYRAIMASSAIPAACHPIKINGQAYYDGGVSTTSS